MSELFFYLKSAEQEKTLEFFIRKLNANKDELTPQWFVLNFEKHLGDGTLNINGIGSVKFSLLQDFYSDIKNNKSHKGHYYPSKYYLKANGRYDSLAERTFDKFLSECFFKNVYLKIRETIPEDEWKALRSNDDEDIQMLHDIIKKSDLSLDDILNEDILELGVKIRSSIKAIYKDMTSVRVRNLIFELWEEKHKKQIKLHKKNFFEKFEKILNRNTFIKKFGEDKLDRCCNYCDVHESQIDLLKENDYIYTKRSYCKGQTMEVDQKDAYKGYNIENIVFCCYWCNNAKTDEFTFEEFMPIANEIKKIWQKRLSLIPNKLKEAA
jgi:hypothetical protein